MSEIDVATGLPRLPENQRWTVYRTTHDRNFEYVKYDSVGIQVFVPERVVIERVVDVPGHDERNWRGRKRWVSQTYKQGEVTKPEHWVTIASKKIKPDGVDLTPEIVLNAALTLMDRLEAEDRSEALRGTYPPKVLP